MGILLTTDGERLPRSPGEGEFFSLPELQEMVGGYIEIVRLVPPVQTIEGVLFTMLVVNEEGLLEALPPNPIASSLYGRPLVGPVLLTNDHEVH